VDKNRAFQRINDVLDVVADILETEQEKVIIKVRKRQSGASQYQKQDQTPDKLTVLENGLKFLVNLHDYIDTGLFLDHRITREMIRALANNRSFLNLFAYTGSVTVYAAAGGARKTTTVDMSNTYLNWARENMAINGYAASFSPSARHSLVRADCLQWIAQAIMEKQKYQLVFIDPPTFSNSSKMSETLDIKRDHAVLLKDCFELLTDDGLIVFSTNARSFKLDDGLSNICHVRNLTTKTTTEDFRRKPQHQCWCLTKQASVLDGLSRL
jgi:23S rRNA (guanine2445-N2)-methyltransferase / 23S rRNA (guanine2069-N7)-methyltransferase